MQPILEVNRLRRSFGAVTAADDITVSIQAGEVVGMIGANGAGKTTFVNMVTGYTPPTRGSIRFMGREVTGMPARRVTRLGIGRSFQVPQLFNTMTALENLLTVLGVRETSGFGLLRRLEKGPLISRAEETLDLWCLAADRDRPAGELPQGARKLLDIAMAMIGRPRLLLLDEPTSGVSAEEKFTLMDTVMEVLAADEMTVLFIEHDMEIVERYVSRVLAFYQGRIICDEPPARAMRDPAVQAYVMGGPRDADRRTSASNGHI